MSTNNIIRGDDGRSYRRQADGRLAEIHDPKAHARRQMDALTGDHIISGLRISNGKNPDAEAIVVTLTEAESKKVMAAVKDVLKVRTAGNA